MILGYTNEYKEILSSAESNTPGRTYGASTIYDEQLIVAFGDDPLDLGTCEVPAPSSGQNPTNTTMTLDVWRINNPDSIWKMQKTDFAPYRLKRVSFTTYDNKLWVSPNSSLTTGVRLSPNGVTHGFGFSCPPFDAVATVKSPVWNPYLWSLKLNTVSDD